MMGHVTTALQDHITSCMIMERQIYTHLAALIGSREEISNANVN